MIQLHDYHARTRLEPRQRPYIRRHLRCLRCIDWPVLGIWLAVPTGLWMLVIWLGFWVTS